MGVFVACDEGERMVAFTPEYTANSAQGQGLLAACRLLCYTEHCRFNHVRMRVTDQKMD